MPVLEDLASGCINASRLTLQPAAAARNGIVYLAWSRFPDLIFGSSAGSDVWYMRSDDGGQTWTWAIITPTPL